MISWIQRTFQHHFKWLFLALLVMVIISFVFITNASSGLGRGAGQRKLPDRPFFGLNLANHEDVQRLVGDAQLSLYLRQSPFQQQPSEAEVQQYALQRHATLHLASKLGLIAPAPDADEVKAYIQTLGRFSGAEGKFDPKAYGSFVDSLKTNPRLSEADFARVIMDDVLARSCEKLLGGPGYVLPSDISEQLARRDTRWTLALASVDGKAFAPRIDTSDTALAAWFETNSRRYEIGPRVSVAAVTFPADRYAAGIALSDAEIRAAYDANPARYAPAASDKTLDPKSDAAFAAARARVEADLRKERAQKAALAAADDLTVKLQGVALDRLPAALAALNLSVEELGPVGVGAIPASLGGDAAASQIAPEVLRLAADRPYSGPLPTPSGAAVLVWRQSIASRVPALAEVREKVLADYQAGEKRRLFNEAGRKLRETVAAATSSGKAFADAVGAAAASAGLKADIKTTEAFTLAQPPKDFDYAAYQALSTLKQGEVSDFIPSRGETGLLVFAVKKDTPAFDPASPAVAEIKTQMSSVLAERSADGLLSSLVEAELAKGAPASE